MPKFDPKTNISELNGKVIVVTGGNAGIGAETVRELAAHNPHTIYLCARTPSKADAFIALIKKDHPNVDIRPIQLDLTSLESAKAAAEKIAETADRLDILVLNAGTGGQAPGLTKEGYEMHMGVNHVGHAMFTQVLMPLVLKTSQTVEKADVRIIVVSSGATRMSPKGGIQIDTLKTDQTSLGPNTCYGQSKLANYLFATKLSQLYPSVKSISLHPGIIKTEIISKSTATGWLSGVFKVFVNTFGMSPADGAKTQLWAATSGAAQTGKFYVPYGKEGSAGAHHKDQKLMDKFWKWTEDELAVHGGKGWPATS